MHLVNQTQRRKNAKFLFLEIADRTEESIGSVSFAFSKINLCVFAPLRCL